MATRDVNVPQLSPGQANYVLERMIRDRRVSAGEVSRYIGDMQREIADLERRLEDLRSVAGGAARAARPRPGRPAPRAARPAAGGAKSTATASQRLQGRYLGLIRQIPESRRAQYAKIAREKGREAAIREMEAALKKAPAKAPARAAAPSKRARKTTAQQAESRRLQGRYLGLIRQIPENKRAQYAKIAKEKGREAAIREMESALRK